VTRRRWVPAWNVLGIPYNYMVPGYRNGVVNTLRLWSAEATRAFDLTIFNSGDYAEAVRAQTFAENISKVLYPEDSTPQGRELRLQQQYFFVACSLRDYLDGTLPQGFDLRKLPEQIIFQLNDTHPVIAIPELMRLLVDEIRPGVGRGLGDHPEVLRLHLPHAAAGGPRGLADRSARAAAAAAPGDHLPDQRGVPRRRSARHTRATRCAPADVDHLRLPAGGADGTPRDGHGGPRSTASPNCTPSCCATRCCPTSRRSGRRSSPMSPTASPRGASSEWPIRLSRR
jgi:hypothetical protein